MLSGMIEGQILDAENAQRIVDANGTGVAHRLIHAHMHPVTGRQGRINSAGEIAQCRFSAFRPGGVKIHAGAPVIERGMKESDFKELAEAGANFWERSA